MRPHSHIPNLCNALLAFTLCAATVAILPGCGGPKNIFPDPNSEAAATAEAIDLKVEGDKLFKDGKHLEAIDKYKESIRKNSFYGDAWNNLGLALEKDNNRYDAQRAYQRSAELMPLNPMPMDNLGVLYMKSNLPEDAKRYFVMALERRPQYLPSVRGAVRAAQLLGDSEEADLERIKMGLRLETDPKWRELFERQLARVKADIEDQQRNSPGFSSPTKKERPSDSDTPQNRVEAGMVTPRIDE